MYFFGINCFEIALYRHQNLQCDKNYIILLLRRLTYNNTLIFSVLKYCNYNILL